MYICVSINDHAYSINTGYLLFFETTIMGETADLAMVQKTITELLKGCMFTECCIKIYSMQSWLEEKYWVEKMCTSNRDDHKLENTVKQSRFKHLGELHKEWTEAGVSASRVTMLRHLQEKRYRATSETETSPEASYLG